MSQGVAPGSFLSMIKPLMPILPEVSSPEGKRRVSSPDGAPRAAVAHATNKLAKPRTTV